MALAGLPIDLQARHNTKAEIETRKLAEEKLKGNNTLVYKIPKTLSKEERKVYKFLVTELEVSGILNNLDITILETTANAIVMMEQCRRLINLHGLVIYSNGEYT